jgi:16S rRNA (guanine1207-N2)-methyltransferase
MLAEALADVRGLLVVSFACGNGLIGAAAVAGGASGIWLTDRHLPSVEAARRTLQANHAIGADVRLGHGAAALPADVVADVVTIRVVPDRASLVLLLHDALHVLRPGGQCYLAGGNHEGAKTAARLLERIFGNVKVLEQHSGHRLVVASRPQTLPDVPADLQTPFVDPNVFHEIAASVGSQRFTLYTRPGVFSWQHVDEATDVLAGLIHVVPGEHVLDLGCGAGALGVIAARQSITGKVCLVDADSEAVRCARRTVQEAGATNALAQVSDVAGSVLGERFDVVIANPPFHVGKQVELDVPRQFIRDAFEVLIPGGRLFLVANRTLPYEAMLGSVFGSYRSVHDGRRFKVLTALKA